MKGKLFGPILGLCVLVFLIWITSIDRHPVAIVLQYVLSRTSSPTFTPGPTSTPLPSPTPNFRDWYERAMADLVAGRYLAAIEDFDEAIRLDPYQAAAYMNRGVAKGRLDRNEEAIQDYSQAIELDPSDACAFRNRGLAKERIDQFQEALADFDSAIDLRSRYGEAYTSRGWVKLTLNQYQNAIDDFDQAILMRNKPGSGSEIELCAAEEVPEQHPTPVPGSSPTSGLTPTPTPTSTPNPCPAYCFSDDDARYIHTYWGRGYTYYRMGNHEAALADLEIALELSREYGDNNSSESIQSLINEIR